MLFLKYCKNCKKLVEKPVPNALPHARFGLNLMLLIMYLRLGLRLPGNKVKEYLVMMYQLLISEGEIVHVLTLSQGMITFHIYAITHIGRIPLAANEVATVPLKFFPAAASHHSSSKCNS